MPKKDQPISSQERWSHFRFSVVGPLLAAPPERGQLKAELKSLAAKEWRHPITGEAVYFAVSRIERWYYRARNAPTDPVGALRRRIREDQGTHPSLNDDLRKALCIQHKDHKSWSYQLHYDNLGALAEEQPDWGRVPSYATILRYMKAHGLLKQPRRGPAGRPGVKAAEERFESREVRSYESEYVNGLWHLDFHSCSLRVLMPNGQWFYPQLLGILDDHSRLGCHAQWYVRETAENLVHGLKQAFQKRGLPRSLMTDNGSAMIAKETEQGLTGLGIVSDKTLFYSPYQNGKQEVFWAQVEGRLLAMLENCTDLTLAQLNEASLAWLEMEYNRTLHSEIHQKPIDRFVNGKDVGRVCPESGELRLAFTGQETRSQRRSDGTISIHGTRFEIPSRYGHLERVTVRYASWDLAHVYLYDERGGQVLCRIYPQDKTKNAEAIRRRRAMPLEDREPQEPSESGMAPLLRKFLREYVATGLPPAYLPKDDCKEDSK